jgi:hypothetical protein
VPTVVHYEPDIFSVPKSDFDSIPGICHSLSSLECFNEMLINRKRYLKAISPNNHSLSEYINSRYLDEFVIWKKFILDKFANIFRIESDIYRLQKKFIVFFDSIFEKKETVNETK